MNQNFHLLSNLKLDLASNISPQSQNRTPTAVFQFVDANTTPDFVAKYKHNNEYYLHPYTRQPLNYRVIQTVNDEHYPQVIYDISVYLALKRLQEFDQNDLKRYYEAIDKSIDNNPEFEDFHDVYLFLYCQINGKPEEILCNHSQPILLPKLISNPWTRENTLTRFRYDAEYREGTITCEMKLRNYSIDNLNSYKLVLCLTTNTVPPRMDYHAIRWVCKIRPRASKKKLSRGRTDGESSYYLHHETGIVIANVYGTDLRFTPQLLQSPDNVNFVRSYFETPDFRHALENSSNVNSSLAIAVIKAVDYRTHMIDRRTNANILRYLPFNELQDVDRDLTARPERISASIKAHKDEVNKQLLLSDENDTGTYSQSHVRFYAAAYTNDDVLLTETLHPPIRNSKVYDPLRIQKIVQPKNVLCANDLVYVYHNHAYNGSNAENSSCLYDFELYFAPESNILNENDILQLFNKPHMCIRASYVTDCPALLQFKILDDPIYNDYRAYIRLCHAKSKDYNPSPIALIDGNPWKYYADRLSVIDMVLDDGDLNGFIHESTTAPTIEYETSLETQPFNPATPLLNSSIIPVDVDEHSNDSTKTLNTPELGSQKHKRFFPCGDAT
ncbi:unnamed protein product [Rotaria magnacalcarata]|uniref:Uncharacterized protein n=2 Tax=Rotaria magnacalcarata TaxID=392030 RepID=A0A819JUE0_9BILA|nr:unnamed protein product [Rotaria magnacalcarata]CAF3935396.1 unnamed protein product [Rotaria magnacalcarata]